MTAAIDRSPGRSRLLARLPISAQERILADCKSVDFGLNEVLYEPNQPIGYVYFPLDGVCSILSRGENGKEIEVTTIGNEGMVGLSLFLGIKLAPVRAVSPVPGRSLRLTAARFHKHLEVTPELGELLTLFAQALMVQIAQGTVCNRAHTIEQRCCGRLLLTRQRVGRDEFRLAPEFLVDEIAGQLQDAKLIDYRGGEMRILDRRRLEQRACACYRLIQEEYDRLLPAEIFFLTQKRRGAEKNK